jgi:hypothetical protein
MAVDTTTNPNPPGNPNPPALPAPATQVMFGVTFVLNDQPIPVYAKDIANASANGIEFSLPQAVDLGTFNDFSAWFSSQFGVAIPDTSTLPPPLDKIAAQLADLDVAVDMLHVKVPPAAPAGGVRAPTQYTVALRATFPGAGFDLIPNILQIKGAVFGVSNEKK